MSLFPVLLPSFKPFNLGILPRLLLAFWAGKKLLKDSLLDVDTQISESPPAYELARTKKARNTFGLNRLPSEIGGVHLTVYASYVISPFRTAVHSTFSQS
jgi:hypothetical protein